MSTKTKQLGAPASRRQPRPTCGQATAPRAETTEEKNQRIIHQAMAAKRRLALADAQQLAAGFLTARAAGKMQRERHESIRAALAQLETDLTARHRLAQELFQVARDGTDGTIAASSAAVWRRAANLVAALLQKHFPVNTVAPRES